MFAMIFPVFTLGSSFTFTMIATHSMKSSQPMAASFIMKPGAHLYFCGTWIYSVELYLITKTTEAEYMFPLHRPLF